MTTAADYLAGSRVYNGGTNNPTSGTNDPTGYIQRGINQLASQRRSGLAATALRQLRPGIIPNPGIQPAAQLPSTPQQHTVTTSPTGRLILTPTTTQGATPDQILSPQNVLPYDDATAAQQVAAAKSYSDQLDAINAARNALQNKVAGEEHALDTNAPNLYRQLLNHYAGRGMAYSSGYGVGYGQTTDQIANQRAGYENELQSGLAGYDQQQQSADDSYNMLLAQLAAASASNSAANGNANMLAGDVNAKPTPTSTKPPTATKVVASKKPSPAKATTTRKPLTPAKTKAVAKRVASKKKPIPNPGLRK